MISFKDMTFCPYWDKCANGKGCGRALTDEVRKAARKWWGDDDPPIAVFVDKPPCFNDIKPEH